MEGNRKQVTGSGDLEDHVRRMILTNNSSTPSDPRYEPQQHARPAVRLPPSSAHMNPNNQNIQHPNQSSWNASKQYQSQLDNPLIVQSQDGYNNANRFLPNDHGGHQQPQNHVSTSHRPPQQSFNGRGAHAKHPNQQQRARFQQQIQVDPNAFQRTGYVQPSFQGGSRVAGPQQLFNPHIMPPRPPYQATSHGEQHLRQIEYLERIAASEISNVEMSAAECDEKESFRISLQQICHEVCGANPARLPSVSLECFGSFKSGFATAGSDMDLVIVVKDQSPTSACFSLLEDDLPRVLEQRLLQLGYGARLLTRTRVPIIKVCEKPDTDFLEKLREERRKWDDLPPEKKYPHLFPEPEVPETDDAEKIAEAEAVNAADHESTHGAEESATLSRATAPASELNLSETNQPSTGDDLTSSHPSDQQIVATAQESTTSNGPPMRRQEPKIWVRERKAGPLDFPKSGVGIQSDINFFNPLGLHNTQLLRCYSLCDPRVRPMILFVKAWAKRRKINSSYSGTLSSYGHVLMVLHYLMNVAQPPVLPNLQASWRPLGAQPAEVSPAFTIEGWSVSFWRNEEEIYSAAQRGMLTTNRQSLGSLLSRYFHYYSSQGGGITFRWMQEVLSLRTIGGILTKEEKGWVKAVTEESEGKRIQHRYLFCIEDPFELNHNVARTVTHNGIVAIRDEFRRAYRILKAIGNGQQPRDGELFAQLLEAEDLHAATEQLKANAALNGATTHSTHSGSPSGYAMHSDPGPPQNSSNQRIHGAQQQFNRGPDRRNGRPVVPNAGANPLNLNDNEAFPILGNSSKSPRKHKAAATDRMRTDEYSEVSGDRAKVILQEVRRKKDEAQAETTAMGAAAAVLEGFD